MQRCTQTCWQKLQQHQCLSEVYKKRNVQVFLHPTVAEIFNSMCSMCQCLKLTLPFSSTTTTTDTSSRPLAPPVIGHICLLHCLCHPQPSQLAETAFPPAWESQTSYMAGGERPQSTGKKKKHPGVFPVLMCSLWRALEATTSSAALRVDLPCSLTSCCSSVSVHSASSSGLKQHCS